MGHIALLAPLQQHLAQRALTAVQAPQAAARAVQGRIPLQVHPAALLAPLGIIPLLQVHQPACLALLAIIVPLLDPQPLPLIFAVQVAIPLQAHQAALLAA